MEALSYQGRTAIVYHSRGLVFKIPWSVQEPLRTEFKDAIAVKKELLMILGNHPRIIQYYRTCNIKGQEGLILSKANCGDLQSYIDREDSEINNAVRRKWSLQLAEAVAYVHQKDILHMNLSTANVLLHQSGQTTNAILADFSGSKCPQRNLSGGLIPNDPYLNPLLTEFNSPKVNLFSLGVVIYIIITGHYPFRERPAPKNEEYYTYSDSVQKLYKEGAFPDLSNVLFGDVIAGCCRERRFETAKEVVAALEAESARSTAETPAQAATPFPRSASTPLANS